VTEVSVQTVARVSHLALLVLLSLVQVAAAAVLKITMLVSEVLAVAVTAGDTPTLVHTQRLLRVLLIRAVAVAVGIRQPPAVVLAL
jgi:hypothetical protein